MEETVLAEVTGGVGIITLNRPDRLNAMNAESGDLFEARIAQMALDDDVRVVVVTGAGDRAFCAGADAERLDTLLGESVANSSLRRPFSPSALDAVDYTQPVARTRYTSPLAIDKPVIAAVNGACAGIGLSLAAACDIRFASRTAKFTAAFPLRGLTAEFGLAWTLPRIIGWGAAADILLSGRKVSAEEALEMRLVNSVLEPAELMNHALAYAVEMAANVSPRSTRIIKQQLRAAAQQSFQDAMLRSFSEMLASIGSSDFAEGLASFRERRPPRFTGR